MGKAKIIWSYLISKGLNACGAAGLMGNLYVESGLNPCNLQNTFNKSLGMTDDAYTAAVDSGAYDNFIKDSAGYGIAQWTFWSRKQLLLNFAKEACASIGDLTMQLDFLAWELSTNYASVWNTLKCAASVLEASNAVLLKYERPADQSEAVQAKRASYGQAYYDKYAEGGTAMTELELRQKVVNTAVSFLGCKESDGSHKKIIDTYNAHKPLARGYAVKYTDAWCATCVSTVAILCELTDIIPTECGCGQQIALFKELGAWQEKDDYIPNLADVVYYDWDDSGTGDNTGWPEHVGFVAEVDGTTIKVIEGNINNAVGYRTISVNGKYIRGYGVPNYASKATVIEPGWVENDVGRWWRNADGTWPASQWKVIDGAYYYFNAEGYTVTNQIVDGTGSFAGSKFYCGTDGKVVANTTITVDGQAYSADEAGRLSVIIHEEAADMFKDVKDGAWYKADVEAVAQLGIMQGTGDGKFEPDRPITRAEMAAVANRIIAYLKVN